LAGTFSIYPIVEKFSKCLNEYSAYLNAQNIEVNNNHQLEIPVRAISVKVYDGIQFFSNIRTENIYDSLNNKLLYLIGKY
jgi:hypothetical protein